MEACEADVCVVRSLRGSTAAAPMAVWRLQDATRLCESLTGDFESRYQSALTHARQDVRVHMR